MGVSGGKAICKARELEPFILGSMRTWLGIRGQATIH
jgi:hypothetical protein